MSIEKQLAMNFSVNGKYLPMELLYIIKSFAFQDRVVARTKKLKSKIAEDFEFAIYSRKNACRWVNDSSETWIIMIFGECWSMEGCNCSLCGNYIRSDNDRISCRC